MPVNGKVTQTAMLALAVASTAADRNPEALGPGMRMRGGDAMMGGPLAKTIDARDAAAMSAEHAFHLMLQTCISCHARFRIETE
ncbi:hypothetical protein [Sinorhizobium numidicum]|uniref:hypothetical protein n=1 Tax=Sinorhizobium numidicum TaxID=680248 RepID=UPI0031456F54